MHRSLGGQSALESTQSPHYHGRYINCPSAPGLCPRTWTLARARRHAKNENGSLGLHNRRDVVLHTKTAVHSSPMHTQKARLLCTAFFFFVPQHLMLQLGFCRPLIAISQMLSHFERLAQQIAVQEVLSRSSGVCASGRHAPSASSSLYQPRCG